MESYESNHGSYCGKESQKLKLRLWTAFMAPKKRKKNTGRNSGTQILLEESKNLKNV